MRLLANFQFFTQSIKLIIIKSPFLIYIFTNNMIKYYEINNNTLIQSSQSAPKNHHNL